MVSKYSNRKGYKLSQMASFDRFHFIRNTVELLLHNPNITYFSGICHGGWCSILMFYMIIKITKNLLF